MVKGNIFSIERYAVHDGGGIRTIVYLKGCPLRCLWCANPEGQTERRQVFYFAERCLGCGRCVEVCQHHASWRDEDGRVGHTPGLCRGCGDCVAECNADARRLLGQEMSVEEVMAVVLKDRAFYRRSGGGITLSGGEPTAQAEFAATLLAECHAKGISTAMETCGYTTWPRLAAIAQHLDLALYDLKHMNSAEHRRLTGVANEAILENLLNLGQMGVPVVVRVPIIPGCNDSVENLMAVAEFVARVPSLRSVELLPYHGYGAPKYRRAGRGYALDGLEPPERGEMSTLVALFATRGVPCRAG